MPISTSSAIALNFYPRSPCGERQYGAGVPVSPEEFLSTLSLRRATAVQEQAQATIYISIHALLAESDDDFFACGLNPKHFYPRSPCGERHPMTGDPRFQFLISIHALLAESDSVRRKPKALLGNFYPRSPCGERPTRKRAPAYSAKFLSTLSLRRAT